jgi:peptidoglycan hydrolase CwlO-like protein
MRRSSITVVLVLLVCAIAIGFYRGWFTLSSHNPDAGTNKVNVNLTVDQGKMQEDVETLKNKAAELAGKAAEGTNELVDPSKAPQ